VGTNGAITGILDKLRGNREMVRSVGGLAMYDLGEYFFNSMTKP
jgi:hypothetical protein